MTWVVYVCNTVIVCLAISTAEYFKIWTGLAYITELLFLLGIVISIRIPNLLYKKLIETKVFIDNQNEKMAANAFIKKMRIIQSILLDNDQNEGGDLKQNSLLIEILASLEIFKEKPKQISLNYLINIKEGATLYDPRTNSQIMVHSSL